MLLMPQLDWRDDHFLLADRNFRLQHQVAESTAEDAFLFYKNRGQVEQFDRFFTETGFRPRRVLELGIWDGGSAAFWTETLDLERYAAIDLQERGDSNYFAAWLAERGRGRVTTHWGVSQTDAERLRSILRTAEMEPLDLVLDDCSHQYAPTKESFEILFPLVRPGGWYVIEDWAWDLQESFQDRNHPWGVNPPLHPLILEIVRASASRPDLIPSVRIEPDFVAIERGEGGLSGLNISDMTAKRPRPWEKIAYRSARARAGDLRRWLRGSTHR
jgi:SAM-dependent methyltransferase